jgi:hypothetical protein
MTVGIAVCLQADATTAAQYLALVERSRRSGTAPAAASPVQRSPLPELVDLVETWFVEVAAQVVIDLAVQDDPETVRYRKAASDFWGQRKFLDFVREANARGVAPNAEMLSTAAGSISSTPRVQRRSAARFRKRWCLSRKKPPVKQRLSREEFSVKVGRSASCSFLPLCVRVANGALCKGVSFPCVGGSLQLRESCDFLVKI